MYIPVRILEDYLFILHTEWLISLPMQCSNERQLFWPNLVALDRSLISKDRRDRHIWMEPEYIPVEILEEYF